MATTHDSRPTTSPAETPVPGTVPRFEIPGWRSKHGLVAGITGRGTGPVPYDLGPLVPAARRRGHDPLEGTPLR